MNVMNKDYIRVKEAAYELSVSPETLRQYAASGKLENKVRIQTTNGGHRRYHGGDIQRLKSQGGLASLGLTINIQEESIKEIIQVESVKISRVTWPLTLRESKRIKRQLELLRFSIFGLFFWGLSLCAIATLQSHLNADAVVVVKALTALFIASFVLRVVLVGFAFLQIVFSGPSSRRG